MSAVTPSLVRRYVERFSGKAPVIALSAPPGWLGGPTLRLADGDVEVAECRSPLEIREQLVRHGASDGRLVILTAVPEAELGEDVLARLAGRRLHSVAPWDLVRDLFALRRLDPRLAHEPWLATALLERTPPGGHAPLSTGVLDREAAWGMVLDTWFGLAMARPDALALLRWSLDDASAARYAAAPGDLRAGLRNWVAETAGVAGTIVVDCLAAGAGHDALPLGIACGVVFAAGDEDAVSRAQAAVRLERYTNGASLTPEVGRRFAAVAAEVVTDLLARQGLRATLPWLDRADVMIAECGASASAHLGAVARCGFESRLARVGELLLEKGGGADRRELADAARAVQAHLLAGHDGDRAHRVTMAVRLARWLRSEVDAAPASSFAHAAASYARFGAYVDWARGALRGGEAQPRLSAAYDEILAAAAAACERRNRRFGELLAGWGRQGGEESSLLPIESVLARVVAPLANEGPVLLVVLDGMSAAVCAELADSLVQRGWVPLRQPGLAREAGCPSTPPVIAAFPTVTEVCRTSLLSGAVAQGVSADEKRGFVANAALRAVTTARHAPVLFHKGELTDRVGRSLAPEVRAALGAPERRVVGVVLNAVDDHLSGSDQVRVPWSLDAVPLLQAILQEAQAAGRIVILTSDHGHVVESRSTLRRADLGDRYRSAGGALQDDEIELRGARVLAPGGAIIAPWSEQVRYGAMKNGYHGGAAAAEVVVPLAVLTASAGDDRGWEEASLDVPAWWNDVPPATVAAPARDPMARRRAASKEPQGDLFAAAAADDWISALLSAPLLVERRARSGRLAVTDERIRVVLSALSVRGGRLTRVALAQQIGVAPLRLTGILAGMGDLLNVDGYPVLTVESASDTVLLDRELLRVQFGLE